MSIHPIHYDESRVPTYTLPDPLNLENGERVVDIETWLTQQRPRLLSIFETEIYGKAPPVPKNLRFQTTSFEPNALNGRASREEVAVYLLGSDAPRMNILLYLPRTPARAIFLGLNFDGNHTIHSDEGITISYRDEQQASARGSRTYRWSLEDIIERGYGLATIYHADISTDLRDGYENSIFPYFYETGQTKPADDEWGAISAWAWGLRCAMEVLECHGVENIALVGHSRMGKAALWAAAQDARCKLVIANNSGCMGAALSRRKFGETIASMNQHWQRWLCRNSHQYNDQEEHLLIDQHTLIALIAPRPVYIASAEDDVWADPLGEFLGGYHANPVYHLFGKEGLPVDTPPPLNRAVMGTIGYHIRSGEHEIREFDWRCFLDFADKHFLDK